MRRFSFEAKPTGNEDYTVYSLFTKSSIVAITVDWTQDGTCDSAGKIDSSLIHVDIRKLCYSCMCR